VEFFIKFSLRKGSCGAITPLCLLGILHKGDGTNIYLKEKPQLLHTVLRNGSRRDSDVSVMLPPIFITRLRRVLQLLI